MTGMENFTTALETLRPDSIVGAAGLAIRHDAMAAAEGSADYVMFGEPDAGGERPSFEAILERVSWWADVFETPCVAFAASLEEIAALVEAGADFIALGGSFDDWIWRDPSQTAAAIAACAPHLRLPETAT